MNIWIGLLYLVGVLYLMVGLLVAGVMRANGYPYGLVVGLLWFPLLVLGLIDDWRQGRL